MANSPYYVMLDHDQMGYRLTKEIGSVINPRVRGLPYTSGDFYRFDNPFDPAGPGEVIQVRVPGLVGRVYFPAYEVIHQPRIDSLIQTFAPSSRLPCLCWRVRDSLHKDVWWEFWPEMHFYDAARMEYVFAGGLYEVVFEDAAARRTQRVAPGRVSNAKRDIDL